MPKQDLNGTEYPPMAPTLPARGASGGVIRAEVVRAMEKQQVAAQNVLDALHQLGKDVRKAFEQGLLHMGE
jgi:hypothetical protein